MHGPPQQAARLWQRGVCAYWSSQRRTSPAASRTSAAGTPSGPAPRAGGGTISRRADAQRHSAHVLHLPLLRSLHSALLPACPSLRCSMAMLGPQMRAAVALLVLLAVAYRAAAEYQPPIDGSLAPVTKLSSFKAASNVFVDGLLTAVCAPTRAPKRVVCMPLTVRPACMLCCARVQQRAAAAAG